MPGPPPLYVGPDRVSYRGDAVAVVSAVEMPGWEYRDHRKIAVVFRGARYYVAEKALRPDGRYRYLLTPWPDDLTDLPGATVHYDERYVEERDARLRREAREDRTAEALSFVSPFLGLLPASLKLKLNDRYAYDPVTVTKQSLVLEYLLLMVLMALTTIHVFAAGLGGASLLGEYLGLVVVVLIALPLDILMRRGPVEAGGMEQPGFFEWAIPRSVRRRRR
jgi:hypothetical protein